MKTQARRYAEIINYGVYKVLNHAYNESTKFRNFIFGGINMLSLSKMAESIKDSPTLALTAKAKELKQQGVDIIGFGAGEPDFDTPEYIKDAAKKALDKGLTKYTAASGIIELKKAICKKLKDDNGLDYEPSQIVVSTGAKQALYNSLMAIVNPGDEVIIPAPYWVSYEELVKMVGGTPVIVETEEEAGFKISKGQLINACTEKTKALLLNNPNNPNGSIYTEEDLREIADVAVEKQFYVISDEIYEKLIYGGQKHVSIAALGARIKDQTIVVNGLSKAYAMTGWRMGYSASNKAIAKIIGSVQSHSTSNPCSIAQYASVAAFSTGEEEQKAMVKEFDKRRLYMYEKINSIDGISCLLPQGAFYIMVNLTKLFGKSIDGEVINNSDDFSRLLLDKAKVVVIPGSAFGDTRYVRLSYAMDMESIVKGLDRIEDFVKKLA